MNQSHNAQRIPTSGKADYSFRTCATDGYYIDYTFCAGSFREAELIARYIAAFSFSAGVRAGKYDLRETTKNYQVFKL
jgi:hypothetical protein